MIILFFVLAGLARAGDAEPYPSGFRAEQCRDLLDAPADGLAKFNRMSLRGKVRDVHALAHLIYATAGMRAPEDGPQIASQMLTTRAFKDLGPKLRSLAKSGPVRLHSYADELLDVNVKLAPLINLDEELDARLSADLIAFFQMVLKFERVETDPHRQRFRAMAFLHVSALQADLGARGDAAMDLLARSIRNLRFAIDEDHAGPSAAGVALLGLPVVLGHVVTASFTLRAVDRRWCDSALAEMIRAEIEPYLRGEIGSEAFADSFEILREIAEEIPVDHLPEIRATFDDFEGRSARVAGTLH